MLSKYDIFCKVVEHSGFTKAANAIQYSQSAVSQTVKNLEQELGLTLLTRGKEGIHLTADGEAIFPYIQAIANAEDALARARLDDRLQAQPSWCAFCPRAGRIYHHF